MSIIPDFYMEATVALGRNATPMPQWYATGFIVGRYEGELEGLSQFSTYLITNKHVVDNESEMVIQVNLQEGVKSYLLSLVDDQGSHNYSKHPSADVIAYHIDINEALSEGAQLPFFNLTDNSLTLQQMRDTGVCEGCLAYTLGFPVSVDDDFVNSTVKSPVCRMGCISRVENTYHGSTPLQFLIDAVTFPGNSGGPVINRPEHIYLDGTPHNASANLIGVVSSYLTYREILRSTQTNRNRVINEENSGLTVVISVDYIKEVVELERTRAFGIAPNGSLLEVDAPSNSEAPVEIPAGAE